MINKMFEIIKDKEKQYQILVDRYNKVNDKKIEFEFLCCFSLLGNLSSATQTSYC